MKYRSRALRLGQQAFVTNLLSRYATRHFFNIVRGITWDFIQSHRILHVKIVLEWSEDYSTILTLSHSVPWISCAQQMPAPVLSLSDERHKCTSFPASFFMQLCVCDIWFHPKLSGCRVSRVILFLIIAAWMATGRTSISLHSSES